MIGLAAWRGTSDQSKVAPVPPASSMFQPAATKGARVVSWALVNPEMPVAVPPPAGETLADCARDVDTALSFAPPHLSIYHLTIEPNTYFAKFPPVVPEDDDAYAMLDLITERTGAAGLQRYEVSAYARPGHRCWHNLNYWQFGDYLGIGAGAHSKLSFAHRVVRQVRAREPRLYMDKARAGDAVVSVEEVARRDLPFEYMLNALRLRNGFELQDFSARTGLPLSSVATALDEGVRRGWLVMADGWVRPTERGFDFLSDLQSLFLPA